MDLTPYEIQTMSSIKLLQIINGGVERQKAVIKTKNRF